MFWNWSFNDTKTRDNIYSRNGSSNKRITPRETNQLNANGNKVKFEGTKTRRAFRVN
jgi:hypothetical protein